MKASVYAVQGAVPVILRQRKVEKERQSRGLQVADEADVVQLAGVKRAKGKVRRRWTPARVFISVDLTPSEWYLSN